MSLATTTLLKLSRVPAGNLEPDLLRDAEGNAYWADGLARVTVREATELAGAAVLAALLARHSLRALDTGSIPSCSIGGDRALYTGESEVMYGGLFYKVTIVDGANFGAIKFTQQAPKIRL